MTLAQLFHQHAAPSVSAAFPSHETLEVELWRLVHAGQAGWPELAVTPEAFVLFLAKQLPPESMGAPEFLSLRAADLYLLCAAGQGHRAALAELETKYMPAVRLALLKLDTPEPLIQDITQALYSRLLERQNAPQDVPEVRRGYAGRGALLGWLCTCAVHEASRRRKRDKREVALEQASDAILLDPGQSPELMLLKGQLKEAFDAAFREASATLTSRERNLLRFHYLSGLTIDQIGTIYRVHRVTAFRWVAQARERLATQTRKRFLLSVPTRLESIPQLMELIRSQLGINLANLLKQAVEDDPPLGGSAHGV